jgi:hypothetical protein
MNRLRLITVGVFCAAACFGARAQDTSVHPSKPARHATKAAPVNQTASAAEDANSIRFSDPYAPPSGARKMTVAQFPAMRRQAPEDPPLGSLMIGVGRDSPDSPFTGGFKLRF